MTRITSESRRFLDDIREVRDEPWGTLYAEVRKRLIAIEAEAVNTMRTGIEIALMHFDYDHPEDAFRTLRGLVDASGKCWYPGCTATDEAHAFGCLGGPACIGHHPAPESARCGYPGCGQPPAYPAHNRFLTTGDELSAHTYQPEANR